MKAYYLTLFTIFIIHNSFAQIPDNYYNGTENLNGNELKTVLYNIIKGHTEFPYTSSSTDVWDILKKTDKDTLNSDNVTLLYTGWSLNAEKEYDNKNGWNREHVWAKSHGNFGTEMGAGTDVHALRPCDISVNSARNNYDFSTGGDIYIDTDGETENKITSNSWEPRDIVKGDVARMIFYMATRYEGDGDEPDLEIVDYVNSSPYKEPFHGKLSDLYQWHIDDPVSDWEKNRNDIIYYQYQGNRNPYIDHPEFVEKIWSKLVSYEEINKNLQISVYPNPFNEKIHIKLNKSEHESTNINLYNIYGNKLKSFKTDSTTINILCSDLKKGIYFLEIIYTNNIVFQKMLIKN